MHVAALIGFGFLPALFLSSSLMGQFIEADWSCCEISFQPGEILGYGGGPSEEEVVCATIPGQLIVASAVFWAITIAGGIAILLYLLRCAHLHTKDQGTRLGTVLGTIRLSMVLFLVVSRYLR